ncbi:hypothetical protein DPMN_068021 [Dreissena polymorpha]|uniref:Uncharacterized protein n=1 Tax=Dreissena polymorpha TaxID=45954 RepID=A0A9D3Z1E5_DREPO|nr:hypothetical protein DPMN_068021 [Dreissena polymorpha]
MHISNERHPKYSGYVHVVHGKKREPVKKDRWPWRHNLGQHVLETSCSCSRPEGKQQPRLPEAQPTLPPTLSKSPDVRQFSAIHIGLRCNCKGALAHKHT